MADPIDPLTYLASIQRAATLTGSARASRICPLLPRQHPLTLRTANLPRVHRDIEQVGAALRATLFDLVAGKLPWPLFLHGPTGTGKTCAALCLLDFGAGTHWYAEDFVKAVIDSRFGRYVRMNSHTHIEEEIAEETIWEQTSKAPLIVLDEFGAVDEATPAHYKIIYKLLTVREFTPHVIVSNLGATELDKIYDDRIVSRAIRAGTAILWDGRDMREDGKP